MNNQTPMTTEKQLHDALRALMRWWMETPDFEEGTDEMPAEIFDAARAALTRYEEDPK